MEGVVENAKLYLDSSWMHTKWLTDFILRHLFDGEVARKVPTWPSHKELLWSAVAFPVLLYLNLRSIAFLWLALWLLYYVSTTARHMKMWPLVACYQEVSSGTYDGPEVARRLRHLERRGVFIHSLILGLLECRPVKT